MRRRGLVESIEPTGQTEPVYNLRVEPERTYFVGGDSRGFDLWAHNAYRARKGKDGYDLVNSDGEVVRTGYKTKEDAFSALDRGLPVGEGHLPEGFVAGVPNRSVIVNLDVESVPRSPNARARRESQGEVTDPLTNVTTQTDAKLEAGHIYPANKITEMPGFEKLTKDQQQAVLNNKGNFWGMERGPNASKGDRTQWQTFRGQNLHPDYSSDLTDRMQQSQKLLQEQIDNFIEGNKPR